MMEQTDAEQVVTHIARRGCRKGIYETQTLWRCTSRIPEDENCAAPPIASHTTHQYKQKPSAKILQLITADSLNANLRQPSFHTYPK